MVTSLRVEIDDTDGLEALVGAVEANRITLKPILRHRLATTRPHAGHYLPAGPPALTGRRGRPVNGAD